MKKKKINKNYFLATIMLILFGIFLSGCSSKKKEIVWYISDPESYGVKEAKAYQEIKSERFQLFNERLEELNISAKVVFKYMPNRYEAKEEDFDSRDLSKKEFLFQTKMIENLISKDSDADIVNFSPLEYDKFLNLNEYLKKEENQKVLKVIPESIWKVNAINKKTYQIPRGNVTVSQLTCMFYKPFLEKYHINLEEEKIKNMTPEEIIAFFEPYFEKERLLDDKYYLTSASDLQYSGYFQNRYIPVIGNSRDCNLAVDIKEKKIVNLLDTPEMKQMLKINHMIYTKNLDAHIERQYKNGNPIFCITDIPTIQELTQEREKKWLEITLGDKRLKSSFGNGVLKNSDAKELAVHVLTASMYDEQLSNIMIYGVPDKDYRLENEHAIYQDRQITLSSMGSFKSIGNNRIAYPNELEVKEKRKITEKLLKQTRVYPYSNFTPVLDKNLSKKLAEIMRIYNDIESKTEFEEIPNFEEFIQEQEQKLKEKGVEQVVLHLQKQLEDWKE
ncbi:hypothetical protein [Faecalimonas sp.]